VLGSGSEGGMAATVVGTPHYLSPELVHGRAYDQKSDIWALGCVLYEITCLHKPFDASNIPGIIMKYVASPAAAVCRLVCVSGCMSVWLLRVCTVRVCACLRVFRVWCHSSRVRFVRIARPLPCVRCPRVCRHRAIC
jgi:hypothetical protein